VWCPRNSRHGDRRPIGEPHLGVTASLGRDTVLRRVLDDRRMLGSFRRAGIVTRADTSAIGGWTSSSPAARASETSQFIEMWSDGAFEADHCVYHLLLKLGPPFDVLEASTLD